MTEGEERTIRIDGRAAGFVRRTLGGFFRAYSYRSGLGYGPFSSDVLAETWVHGQDRKGPIARYSR